MSCQPIFMIRLCLRPIFPCLTEFVCGEKVAQAVSTLTEEGKREDLPISALNTVMERYANFEKNLGHMLAANEIEITTFLLSDTPMSKLLNKDIPAVTAAKTELEQLTRWVIIPFLGKHIVPTFLISLLLNQFSWHCLFQEAFKCRTNVGEGDQQVAKTSVRNRG